MYELRRVVNVLLKKHGKFDEIKIELAREMKMSKEQRDNIRKNNSQREERNDEAKKVLDEHGLTHSRNNIHKYLLWKELHLSNGNAICPYTGKTIGITDLFNNNKFQIEHIVPISISGDDSFANKTICEAKENQLKGNKTPYQFYGNDPVKWAVVKERVKKIFVPNSYRKYKRFILQKIKTDDFVSRQLNDTRYISSEAKKFMKNICEKVTVSSGQATAELRHFWGLNSILGSTIKINQPNEGHYWVVINKENEILEMERWTYKNRQTTPKKFAKKGEVLYGYINNNLFHPQKKREDHRHHAIDAIAIACMKPNFVREISNWNKYNRKAESSNFPKPWEHSFHNDVSKAINNILISFATNRNVLTNIEKNIYKRDKDGKLKKYLSKGKAARGQLHKETIYGKHKNNNDEEFYHVRKPLETITKKAHVEKIVDNTIKQKIINRLKELNVDITTKYSIPKNAFSETIEIEDKITNEKKTLKKYYVYLPNNKGGQPVPIKKVRLKENIGNAELLKRTKVFAEKKQKEIELNQWVNPKNNHHVAIYENENSELFEKIITFWEAVDLKKDGIPVINRQSEDGKKFVTSLQQNDMFIMGLDKMEIKNNINNNKFLEKYLYRVQNISKGDYSFRKHLASTLNNPNEYIRIGSFKKWQELNPIKVKIDILGNIHINN